MSRRRAAPAALPGALRAVQALRQVRAGVRRRLAGDVAGLGHALVERFEPDGLSGWVVVPSSAGPVRVALHVGETEVMATWAAERTRRQPSGAVRGFSLRTKGLWRYCRRSDRVTVRIGGREVPIVGHGMWLSPAQDGPQDLAALLDDRARGLVFGRSGRRQLSKALDADWQRRVLALYARARTLLADELGHDVFLLYGTLLGHVREGGPIGHDNDFDCGYVSRHTDPREAARELQQIALRLVDRGLHVDARGRLLHLHDEDDRRVRIDLFHLYFDDTGTLRFPFGAAGTRTLRRGRWRGVRESEFSGAPVLVPVEAELLVEVLYGAGWRQPVPGFSWERERRQYAREARLPDAEREQVHWALCARQAGGKSSPLVEQVLARADLPRAVVDLGPGHGRDAFPLARAGRTVTAVERSQVDCRHTSERAAQRGLADRLVACACDLADERALSAVLDAARERAQGGALLFYARSLLPDLPQDLHAALRGAVRDRARPGDVLALDLRGAAEGETAHGLAEACGFVLLEEPAVTALPPYRGQERVLHRLLARRP